jgi:hypothetical protein
MEKRYRTGTVDNRLATYLAFEQMAERAIFSPTAEHVGLTRPDGLPIINIEQSPVDKLYLLSDVGARSGARQGRQGGLVLQEPCSSP